MTDGRGDLEKSSVDGELEKVKCITWNIKLKKSNEEVSALIDFGSEANLISRGYSV